MPKIYFIINSLTDAHSIRRINDFIDAGAEIKVFGFVRNNASVPQNGFYVLGRFSNTLSYRRRITIYQGAIKKLFKEYPGKEIVWYYLGLDVALVATLLSRNKKYIYEECDLVHAYIGNHLIGKVLEWYDKRVIKNSLFTILTSEGFMEFHYGKRQSSKPNNIILVENKLPKTILNIKGYSSHMPNCEHLRFAFVGGLRYKALLSLAKIISSSFPQHSFHFYGVIAPKFKDAQLPKAENIQYHGRFESPKDLPIIYSNVDVVVATYDVGTVNERYAEPNKLYESIFFRCPIIVSSGTFLAEKVHRMGIGYNVDAYNKVGVVNLVHNIEGSIQQIIRKIEQIDPLYAIGDNKYAVQILSEISRII
jgi:succinoglycan biosynthesis protein ExoL